MTEKIEPARLLELCEAFDLYDADGEGVISLADVPRLLKSIGVVVPDAALANMLHHFAQSTVDAGQPKCDRVKRKVASVPNDDFGCMLATTDPAAGPIMDRDENGVAHPKLTGKVKVEKVQISIKELLDLLGSGGESDEQREREHAAGRSVALQNALLLFDTQKNGKVTVEDLRKALRISVGAKDALTDVDIDRIVDIADPDKTGIVNYEELSDQLFVE